MGAGESADQRNGRPVHWLQAIRDGRPKTIATMGTSLTAGSGWPERFNEWLTDQVSDPSHVALSNIAVSGSASDNADPGLSGIQTQLPKAEALRPDVLFIEFGINDAHKPYDISPSQSRANLEHIIDVVSAARPDTDFVLLTMNNATGNAGANRPNLPAYCQGYRDVAAERGLMLIDLAPRWIELHETDPDTWASYVPDGLHPNPKGVAAVTLPGIIAGVTGR